MSFTTLGDDIAVLLDHLEIPKADLVGHSFGGASAIRAAMAENMMQTPTGKSSKQWPEPQRFLQFLDKMGNTVSEDYDWSADIATLPMPVLLVFADNDSVAQKHIAEFFALLGGGVREPAWLNTQLSKSRLGSCLATVTTIS